MQTIQTTEPRKFSYRELQTFAGAAAAYLERSPKTKLAYALNRVLSRCRPLHQQISDSEADLFLEHALTEPKDDANGKLLMTADGKSYECTKAAAKLRDAARRTLYTTADLEVPTYFATKIPTDLTEFELEAFSGIVITAEQVEEILRAREESEEEDEAPKPIASEPADQQAPPV